MSDGSGMTTDDIMSGDYVLKYGDETFTEAASRIVSDIRETDRYLEMRRADVVRLEEGRCLLCADLRKLRLLRREDTAHD